MQTPHTPHPRTLSRHTDGNPLDVLGNAFVALFFSTSHNPLDLDRALGAYQKAVRPPYHTSCHFVSCGVDV